MSLPVDIVDLERIAVEARARLADLTDLDGLASLESEYLGKSSALMRAKKQLGGLEPDQRKAAGRAVNDTRTLIERAIAETRERLFAAARAERLEAERLDLTETRERLQIGRASCRERV